MLPANKKDYNFVKRTQENLLCVSKLLEGESVQSKDFYDFTNLINNCLGLIAYVYEYSLHQNVTLKKKDRLQKVVNKTPVCINKYGKISKCLSMNGTGLPDNDLSTLLYHMRNAICHGHIEPFSSGDKDNIIAGAIFWDKNSKGRNFEISMTIKEIEEFIYDIAEAYNSYYNIHNQTNNNHEN